MTWHPDARRERRARRPDPAVGWPAQREADHRPVHAGRPGRDALRQPDDRDAVSTSTPTRCTTGRTCSTRRGSRSRRTGTSSARRPRPLPSRRSRAASRTSYLTAIRPNSFHFSQYLYQDGGTLLNADNTAGRLQLRRRRRRRQHPEGDPRRRQRQVLAGCQQRPDPGDQVGRGRDVPGRAVLHGLAQDGRPRAVRQVGRRHRAILPSSPAATSAAPVSASRSRPTHKEAAWLAGPVPAQARTAGRRLHLRRRRAGHDGRAAEPGADQAGPVLRRPGSRSASSSSRWRPRARSRTSAAWDDIDTAIGDAMEKALLGKADAQAALDDAVTETNDLLKK